MFAFGAQMLLKSPNIKAETICMNCHQCTDIGQSSGSTGMFTWKGFNGLWLFNRDKMVRISCISFLLNFLFLIKSVCVCYGVKTQILQLLPCLLSFFVSIIGGITSLSRLSRARQTSANIRVSLLLLLPCITFMARSPHHYTVRSRGCTACSD